MLQLIEFPADDLERARRFWEGLLGAALDERHEDEGRGLQTRTCGVDLGVHQRAPGPGNRWSLSFQVADVEAALSRVVELGGAVVHPGDRWATCRDSEGSPFGLTPGPTRESRPLGRAMRFGWSR
jgi:predicted enzyme related to lactoylglutathione lyase